MVIKALVFMQWKSFILNIMTYHILKVVVGWEWKIGGYSIRARQMRSSTILEAIRDLVTSLILLVL